jgi:undecaprenyl-phosphate galactose phosphotransferase
MTDASNNGLPVRLGHAATVASDWAALKGRRRFYRAAGKRLVDIVLSLSLLLMLAPVFLMLAVLSALDGASPFYVQRRVGLRGRPFGCIKFRSMVPDADARLAAVLASDPAAAEEWRLTHKLVRDPRITPIGRILRKTSLDELPQLWNVLMGDMSIVGPRPVTEAELEKYGPAAAIVLSTRPGITGLWQVQGRGRGTSYEERVQMDLRYVRSMTLPRDIGILAATAMVVLRGTGT